MGVAKRGSPSDCKVFCKASLSCTNHRRPLINADSGISKGSSTYKKT